MLTKLKELYTYLTDPRHRQLAKAQRMYELGSDAFQLGNVQEAKSLVLSSLKICHSLLEGKANLSDDNPIHICLRLCLWMLLRVHGQAGEHEQVIVRANELLDIYNVRDDRWNEKMRCLKALSAALVATGRHDEARTVLRDYAFLLRERNCKAQALAVEMLAEELPNRSDG